jgi:putative ABC transport system ATP-binding protein
MGGAVMTGGQRPVVELVGEELRLRRSGVQIQRGIDIDLRSGERVALAGPSGSGKTTLTSVRAGLAEPDSGTVILDGRPLADHGPQLRRRVGIVFHGDALVALLTAAENVEMALVATGFPQRRQPSPPERRSSSSASPTGRSTSWKSSLVASSSGWRSLARSPGGPTSSGRRADRGAGSRPRQPGTRRHPRRRRPGAAVLLATHDAKVVRRCDRRLYVVDGALTDSETLA